MSYFILVITFLIALSGLFFKTSQDTNASNAKKLNKWGWVVLVLLCLGLIANVGLKYQEDSKKEKEAYLAEDRRLKDSARAEIEKKEMGQQLDNLQNPVDSMLLNFELMFKISGRTAVLLDSVSKLAPDTAEFGRYYYDIIKKHAPQFLLYIRTYSMTLTFHTKDVEKGKVVSFSFEAEPSARQATPYLLNYHPQDSTLSFGEIEAKSTFIVNSRVRNLNNLCDYFCSVQIDDKAAMYTKDLDILYWNFDLRPRTVANPIKLSGSSNESIRVTPKQTHSKANYLLKKIKCNE